MSDDNKTIIGLILVWIIFGLGLFITMHRPTSLAEPDAEKIETEENICYKYVDHFECFKK